MTTPSPDPSQPVVTVAEMVAAEQTIFDSGISVEALMQRAGEGAAQFIWRIGARTPTLVVCGPGNNGGDGYVIAETLRRHGVPVTVAQARPAGTDAARAARAARAAYGGPVVALDEARPAAQFVDCLFGSGLSRAIDEALWAPFERLFRGAMRRYAIDLPSGIASDSAQCLNSVGRFDHCIALGAWKFAHMLRPTSDLMGQLSLVDIGAAFEGHKAFRMTRPRFHAPGAAAHKYSRGLVTILAGDMPGAAILAALAAQGAGAGYVKIAAMTSRPAALPADIVWDQADTLSDLRQRLGDPRIAAVLVGPGLGRDEQAREILVAALAAKPPLVLDGDALHLVRPGRIDPGRTTIFTPHHGEFESLSEDFADELAQANKVERARMAARHWGTHLVYKGADSVMVSPGGAARIADHGNSWLSVAGSGDVLAGTIAARLAVTGEPMAAMVEGQWLHDRAARLAGPAFGASDLAGQIRHALADGL